MFRYLFRSSIALATATLPMMAGAGELRVFIPEGSADAVRIVDPQTGASLGRIENLLVVHGLAGSLNSPYLVAGSYSEVDREEALATPKPTDVSRDEHAAHHAKPPARIGPQDAGISLLSVLDAESGELVRRIEVPGAVHHVAISPDGKFAVATHPASDGVSIVDLTSLELVAWVPTGPMSNYAVFGADPGAVYISNAGNGTISEVDLERGIVRRNLLAGEDPEHLVTSLDGTLMFVADAAIGRVIELEMSSGRELRRFEIGGEIHGLDLSEDGKRVLVAAKETDRIVSVSLGSGEITSAPLSPAPYHLTTIPGTDRILVSSRDEPKVWIVDADSLSALGEIPIEGEGHQMVVQPPS
ncbi:YncE family protein [Vannielia litorea]|uniref:YncE family protein n=1 Tax=Vannielia litorea TaxID=1217970 RepID=UPI001BCF9819|nr:YncE family protein [Vannielia litorea]MBS8226068.1 YncE family protein [Vannielia litorea]